MCQAEHLRTDPKQHAAATNEGRASMLGPQVT